MTEKEYSAVVEKVNKSNKPLKITFSPPHICLIHEITNLFGKTLEASIKKSDRKLAGKRMINVILGHDAEFEIKGVKDENHTKKEYYIADLFRCGKEVYDSYYRMEMTINLSKKLGTHRGFKKNELLNFYNESFINEFYIFTERVIQLFRIIEKKAEKLKLSKKYKLIVGFRRIYTDEYKPFRNIRNNHTHIRRHLSKEFERLDTIIMYNNIAKDKWMDHYFQYTFRNIKKDHIKELEKKLQELHDTTDKVLLKIKNILFDDILPRL